MIPMDVTVEILIRLPVKSLLRFKVVSKSWLSLLSSRYFVDYHLKHSLRSQSKSLVVLTGLLQSSNFYSLGVSEPSFDLIKLEIDKSINNNNNNNKSLMYTVGSCHGMLCVQDFRSGVITIYNPTTRSLLGRLENASKQYCVGFGYDNVRDDYKILAVVSRLAYTHHGNIASLDHLRLSSNTDVKLYSLRRGSWKSIKSRFKYTSMFQNRCGKYLNGALHWLLNSKHETEKHTMVAFHLNKKRCRTMSLPDEMQKGHYERHYFNLEVLGLDLCFSRFSNKFVDFEVYVMKEYGVMESLIKLFSFTPHNFSGVIRPLCYSTCRSKVLLESGRKGHFWYDLKTGDLITKNDTLCKVSLEHGCVAAVCVESLGVPRGMVALTKSCNLNEVPKGFECMKPLAYSDDGAEVLLEQDNEKILWYNLKKKTVKYVAIHGLPESFETVVCSGSLVETSNAARRYRDIY